MYEYGKAYNTEFQVTIREKHIFDWFEKNMPDAKSELVYTNAYELLVAVILSAQCTDKRVNMTTPAIFKRYPDPKTLAKANKKDLFSLISSISFPNNKTEHLMGMAKMLVAEYNGQIPDNAASLVKLPGVGRKTANVILSVIFNQPAMAVDTHVFRVAARLGLSKNAKTPEETEKQLVKLIPKNKLGIAHHWLILHGRYVCTARHPKCLKCGIYEFCTWENREKI